MPPAVEPVRRALSAGVEELAGGPLDAGQGDLEQIAFRHRDGNFSGDTGYQKLLTDDVNAAPEAEQAIAAPAHALSPATPRIQTWVHSSATVDDPPPLPHSAAQATMQSKLERHSWRGADVR